MLRLTGRRPWLLACAVAAVGLLAPSSASAAAVYEGQTSQGRDVSVQVADDGFVSNAEISWKTEDCDKEGTHFRGSTAFARPFDDSTATSFASAGSYRVKQNGGRIKSKVKVEINGQLPSSDRWTGDFKAKIKVKRRGKLIDRCTLSKIDWSASLSAARG